MSELCRYGCYWECEHKLAWLRAAAGTPDPMLMAMQKELETRSVADIAADVRVRLVANLYGDNSVK